MALQTEKIIHLLDAAYNGKAWHGGNMIESLKDLTATQAAKRPLSNIKSIWEYVLHLIQWRIFCIKKLQKNASFDIILNTENDWPKLTNTDKTAWEEALKKLEITQNELKVELRQLSEEALDEIVINRRYSVYELVIGILQHDAYHQGQINLLRKFL